MALLLSFCGAPPLSLPACWRRTCRKDPPLGPASDLGGVSSFPGCLPSGGFLFPAVEFCAAVWTCFLLLETSPVPVRSVLPFVVLGAVPGYPLLYSTCWNFLLALFWPLKWFLLIPLLWVCLLCCTDPLYSLWVSLCVDTWLFVFLSLSFSTLIFCVCCDFYVVVSYLFISVHCGSSRILVLT